jgi:hypothetical protein
MEPLPNCFSICERAAESALALLSSMDFYPYFEVLKLTGNYSTN